MKMRYQARAARGARFLDEVGPKNWAMNVHVDELHMGVSHSCVLAQVEVMDFYDAIQIYRLNRLRVLRYGFDLVGGNYAALDEAWRQQIYIRQIAWLRSQQQHVNGVRSSMSLVP